MKIKSLTLAAVSGVTLSALAVVPNLAQAAPTPTYQLVLGFNATVLNDTCQAQVSQLGNQSFDLSFIDGQTLPIPMGNQTTAKFTEDSGAATPRDKFTLTVKNCPSSVNEIDVSFDQKTSSFEGNGILGNNDATGASNVGVQLSSNTGGTWNPIDFQNANIPVDVSAGPATVNLGYRFHTTDNNAPDTGHVSANVGFTVTYQ